MHVSCIAVRRHGVGYVDDYILVCIRVGKE